MSITISLPKSSGWIIKKMFEKTLFALSYSPFRNSRLSVRNGDAGKPALLNKSGMAVFEKPIRTATGRDTSGLETITVLSFIVAVER